MRFACRLPDAQARLLVHTSFFFFFNDTATTEIYTLSLHDALPISFDLGFALTSGAHEYDHRYELEDRKSTRLNSSHVEISYAVFCLKKKNKSSVQRAGWSVAHGTRYHTRSLCGW